MQCPACGSSLRDGARVCLSCGEVLRHELPSSDRLQVAPAGVPAWIALEKPPSGGVDYAAGRLQRLLAFIADSLLVGSAAWLAATPFGGRDIPLSREGVDRMSLWGVLPLVVLHAAYFILFAASGWQATPGKRLMGMRIRTVDDGPITIFTSVARFLYQQAWLVVGFPLTLFAVSFSPWAGLLPFLACGATALAIWMLCADGRSPWDWMAGTRVVE